MVTTCVNKRTDAYDVYIGRPTLVGNPFEIGKHGDRAKVIELYREWFYKQLANNQFKTYVEGLKGQRLACWCKPLSCHGDVIVEYLETPR